MKKVLAIIALLGLSAGAAYSATTWAYPSTSGTYTLGTAGSTHFLDIKPSANVGFAYDGGTTGVAYVVGSYHAQGSRVFGGSSTDTNIFYKDITAPGIGTLLTGTDLPAVPTPPNGAFSAGWTAAK
ncbi:hypothetical protein KP004_07730 [Geomonas oryzisoli]|uniref:PEP-CTERM sorting domain-containing protein n=1 Tax=Geomonas oryzisoli TaxID=2847992 RepID=A0ABX8JCC4_9BACT|nr:hypothetical protein [Geomonas oryzisoli]QWV95057.1 hypothetical protein KP004_07730 [Geomonas oryzisoli]